MGVNKVMLIGRLGKDPELRYSQSQTAICNFTLATGERRKDSSGNWGEHTEWHKVVCFGNTAENCNKYLKKGKEVYVEGRIQTQKWQDKEGKDRWTTEIVANTVQFLGGKSDSAESYSSSNGASAPAGPSADPLAALPSADQISSSKAGNVSFEDDEIPF